MADENKPAWMEEAEKAGWASPDVPEPADPEPEPRWMADAREAGWNPTTEELAAAAPPEPEPQWMVDARAAGWNPHYAQPPAPMPMGMPMAPPPGPPIGPMGPLAPAAPPPEKPNRRGWVIAGSVACVLLVLGVGAAVLIAVTGSDDTAKLVPPPTQATAAQTPKSVTTVIVRQPKQKKAKVTSTPQISLPSNPGGSTSSVTNAAADRAAVEGVLTRHFQNLVDGNYQSSYNDLTGGLAGNPSTWINAQRQDGLYEFSLNVSPSVSGTSATANILNFKTKAADSGCHTWSGSWQLTKIAGSWKISRSNLARGGC